RRELERLRRLERKTEPARELLLDPIDTAVVDRVFEARVHAVAAVAVVALNADDVLGDGDDIRSLAVPDHRREPRIRLRITVGHAGAAAARDVVARDLVAARDRDEAKVLPKDVDVVERRHDEADLELARHVRLAVDRLLVVARRGLGLAPPDLAVRARL